MRCSSKHMCLDMSPTLEWILVVVTVTIMFFFAVVRCKKEAWVTAHPSISHLYLERVTGITEDLCTMLTSHSIPLWAHCGDELTAASNIIHPSDSSSIWFTSQQAHWWGINVFSALIPLLLFLEQKGLFSSSFLMLVYLLLIFGQMHFLPLPGALLVSH